jgi:hypothetical protein
MEDECDVFAIGTNKSRVLRCRDRRMNPRQMKNAIISASSGNVERIFRYRREEEVRGGGKGANRAFTVPLACSRTRRGTSDPVQIISRGGGERGVAAAARAEPYRFRTKYEITLRGIY